MSTAIFRATSLHFWGGTCQVLQYLDCGADYAAMYFLQELEEIK